VFFFQAEDGIRAGHVTGVQTCALPILFCPFTAALVPSGRVPRTVAPPSSSGAVAIRSSYIRRKPAALSKGQNSKPPSTSPIGWRSEERRVGKEGRPRWRS